MTDEEQTMTDTHHRHRRGTENEGKGLAYRWAKAGYRLIIGSRVLDKALAAADDLNQRFKGGIKVEGMVNQDAARLADLVVITVPFAAHIPTLEGLKEELKGKILIVCSCAPGSTQGDQSANAASRFCSTGSETGVRRRGTDRFGIPEHFL